MKKGILFLLLVCSGLAQAQSLKEALYGGKLKNEPGTVIRKGDDLSSKMDTARKTSSNDSGITKTTFPISDSSTNQLASPVDSSANLATIDKKDTISASIDTAASEATPSNEIAAAPKDNNAVWKEYVNTVINTLKTEALPSKKVKRGSYYALVSYTIGTDGQVTIGDVSLSPENSFLQQQIKERLALEPPRMNPVLNSAGTPRKVNKKYNFTLTKE